MILLPNEFYWGFWGCTLLFVAGAERSPSARCQGESSTLRLQLVPTPSVYVTPVQVEQLCCKMWPTLPVTHHRQAPSHVPQDPAGTTRVGVVFIFSYNEADSFTRNVRKLIYPSRCIEFRGKGHLGYVLTVKWAAGQNKQYKIQTLLPATLARSATLGLRFHQILGRRVCVVMERG